MSALERNIGQLPTFEILDEPSLSFSSIEGNATHRHPLSGLTRFGAFDQDSFQRFAQRIRVAYVGPKHGVARVRDMRESLLSAHQNTDRNPYARDYPGFERLFKVDVASAVSTSHVIWPEKIADFGEGTTVAARVRSGIYQSLKRLEAVREQFDVAMVYIPDNWLPEVKTREFDAHHELKVLAAQFGIPTQVVNDKSLRFQNHAARAWRLAIALYAKAGGTPWKLARIPSVPEDTAYIGLAYAIRQTESRAHFVTCCSQVFDTEGGGMQFVAFQANDEIRDLAEAKRNPFLSRADMRAVLTRSLRLYMDGHPGRTPKRLVVHKTTAFTDCELQGVRDATQAINEVECIEVASAGAWRGVWMLQGPSKERPVIPHGYPVPRGTMLMTSSNSCLLWLAGNAPAATDGRDFFQGGNSIPRPIVLRRHMGRGPFQVLGLEVMALAKMDWNNDALYDQTPVTIKYSQGLSRIISKVQRLPGNSYPYRLFM
ncbi:nuclease PIN [Paucibacter sp. B2R-40]|uniref:argonaute/piwi family protein n=1 Tax=Paucibacter sp. B2R-40 TaxID=2893554 RepID=UPI0021E36A3E|nr:nuclease PIN [Paucibacter sp. B2R-40]MCV2355412.1 nuclease PIN [Paucibacter sp. B2R-40]